MKRLPKTAVFLTIAILAAPLLRADCPETTGHWPYGSSAVVTAGDGLVVYGVGTVLRVADVSDPSVPEVLGEVRMGGIVESIALRGTIAHVAAREAGLVLVDLSDPRHPMVIGRLGGLGYVLGVALRGTTAWVIAMHGDDRLIAVDVTDPATPTKLSGTHDHIASTLDIAMSGDRVLVAGGGNGLLIFDGSNPGSGIPLVGQLEVEGTIREVSAAGDLAFVGTWREGTHVVDLSDPAHPTIVKTIEAARYVKDLLATDRRLYQADSGASLTIFDTSDPTNPVELGTLDHANGHLALDGDTLFSATGSNVVVADVAEPAAPTRLATLDGGSWVRRIALAGSLAVFPWLGELQVVDVADPARPVSLWRFPARRRGIYGVATTGALAYLALYKGLQVVDLSAPGGPRELGWTVLDVKASRLSADGSLVAMVNDSKKVLVVVDVSDPTQPRQAGRLDLEFTPRGIVLAGQVAYISENNAGLHVVDLSDPSNPRDVRVVPMSRPGHALAVDGQRLFVGDSRNGMHILDISDALDPTVVGLWEGDVHFSGIAPAEDLVGVATIYQGFFTVDISDPTSPVTVGNRPMIAASEGAAVSSSTAVVVSELDGGVEVFDLAGCTQAPLEAGFVVIASEPTTAEPVRLADSSTGGIESWSWDFGDGTTSTLRNPSHLWTREGSYHVTLRVSGPGGTDTASHTVTVAEGTSPDPTLDDPGTHAWVIPGSAHTPGLNGTSWVTDVVLQSAGPADAMATLFFLPNDGDGSSATGHQVLVRGGTSVLLADVVHELFGLAKASGAILVGCDTELLVASRTYNDAASGTYGQFIPGRPAGEGSATGLGSRLLQLSQSSSSGTGYRTNIGLTNLNGMAATVNVHLYDGQGGLLGTVVEELEPWEFVQIDGIFRRVSSGDVDEGYAVVDSHTPGATFFAYASVVDNRSGDPVNVPALY